MKYTHLGRSGLSISRLCLGTMNFGPLTDEPTAFAIMDRAHETGVNFFDTANVYGRRQTPPGQVADNDQSHAGWTEEIVGRWFAQGDGRRERTVLATKVYGNMSDLPNESRLSALNIKRACEASLRRLQTDYIDIYQMHHIDRDTPWDEIWEAMDVLRHQGKIVYVGSSNFGGWHIAQAQEAAKQRHCLGLVSEQSLYNLFVRDIEREVLPAAAFYGLSLIPWSPLQGGLLGGAARQAREGRRRLQGLAKETLETKRPQVESYEKLCDELGAPPATVALAWLLTRPTVAAPIIGPRTLAQFDSALPAVDLDLDGDTLARLDDIFPGHKPAPEDYAW